MIPQSTMQARYRLAIVRPGIALIGALALATTSHAVSAQVPSSETTRDSHSDSARAPHYWRDVAAGFASSILIHEGAHIVTSLALGAHPTFGFDKGRPTVYSGINTEKEPRKQFLFSSMGLNAQAVLDEGILDVPHSRGSPFERGVLASGIATALFYITIGRTAAVSDVDFMARTSSLTKTNIALIYGGVAGLHAVRLSHDGPYANFFVRPASDRERGLRLGV